MACGDAEALISARIDGQLSDADRAQLAAHLGDCPDCRETQSAWQAQHETLGGALLSRRESAEYVSGRVIQQLTVSSVAPAAPTRWWPLLLSAAAGFLLAVMVWRPWRDVEVVVAMPPVAELRLSTGRTEVLRPGQQRWEELPVGAGVEAGSVVRTGPAARSELTTSDGALVRMDSDTQVHFDDRNDVRLAIGRVFTCPTPAAPLKVQASDTEVTAVDGQFDLKCSPERQQVVLTAVRGDADVRAKGKQQKVSGGHSLEIVDGTVVERRQVLDLIMATNWIHELLTRKRDDDPELNQRVDAMLAALGEAKISYLYEDEIRAMGAKCALPLSEFIRTADDPQQAKKRRNAARILADIAPTSSVGDLIALLKDADGEVRAQAARGLTRLTGQDQGLPAEQWAGDWKGCQPAHERWLTWWEKNQSRYARRE